jgi:hypothetical protein
MGLRSKGDFLVSCVARGFGTEYILPTAPTAEPEI